VLDGAEDACRQEEDGCYQGERSAYGDADETEGKKNQPDQRVEEEQGQRQGPAYDEKNAKEQKIQHKVSPVVD
jgi:hypothetical protein